MYAKLLLSGAHFGILDLDSRSVINLKDGSDEVFISTILDNSPILCSAIISLF